MAEDNSRNVDDTGNLWDTALNPDWHKEQMGATADAKLSKTTALLPGGQRAKMYVSKENAVMDLSAGSGTLIWQANIDGSFANYRMQGVLESITL